MAKYLAAEAAWEAGNACIDCHGGYGYAEEYDVERKFRECAPLQDGARSTTTSSWPTSASTSSACRARTEGRRDRSRPQAILTAAALPRPSSLTLCSRMRNFWTLPVTVMGKASTNLT